MDGRTLKNPHRRKKRVKDGFYKYYAIFCAALAVLISVGIAVFYDFIRTYESSLPEHVAERYVKSLDGETFSALISDRMGEIGSGFETESAVGSTLADAMADGVTFTEAIGGSLPVYDVFCGGKLMKITLTPTEKLRYGFSRYEVDGVEIYDEWITSRVSDITVIVPSRAYVNVNGTPVSIDYLTGKEYESASLSVFERDLDKLAEYRIPNVFGTVSVTADYDGEPLIISVLGGNTFYSDFDTASRFDYTVKAPADAVVTVNGVDAAEEFVTSTEYVTGVFSEFEPESSPTVNVYTIPSLMSAPDVSVTLAGEVLTPVSSDSSHSEYAYSESYRRQYTVRVPRGITLYCNGIEVADKYKLADGGGTYSLPTKVSGAVASEKYETYVIGLYDDPEFTTSAVCAAEHDGYNYTFYAPPKSSEEKDIRALSEQFTKLFVKYSYEGTQYTQQNYDNVMTLIMKGSPADTLITTTLNAYIYNSHFTVDKLVYDIRDIARYSDNCISVKIDFDSHGTYYKYEKSGAGTYSLVWVKTGDVWRVAEFSM